jgi:AraC-like DNA-binding protein
MPFYRQLEIDIDPAEAAGFSPDDVPRAAVAFGADLVTKGMDLPLHRHRKAQLLFALRGTVTCEADRGVWIVPQRCAVWIPGDLLHRITAAGDVEVYCLFVEPEAVPALPRHCCTVSVSPFLEQLLLHLSRLPEMYDVEGADGRIASVLLDQLSAAPIERRSFPMPVDPKLRRIATAMMADPSERITIEEWGRWAGAAPRTLTRILKRETGMSFGRWRQQLHILIALQRLTQGASVQTVALDLGYEGASAFVTMFRKALGKPPARYLAGLQLAAAH